MRRIRAIEDEVLTRPGRYKPVADNLQVKEVWVGDGERRKRYVLCLNPRDARRAGGGGGGVCAALEEWTREQVPLQWAIGQNNLSNAADSGRA